MSDWDALLRFLGALTLIVLVVLVLGLLFGVVLTWVME